jgi:hypothetical protein
VEKDQRAALLSEEEGTMKEAHVIVNKGRHRDESTRIELPIVHTVTQQLAAKSPGAGKLLVALTREQVGHLLDLLDEQVIPDRPCGDCVPIIAALQEAYGQWG